MFIRINSFTSDCAKMRQIRLRFDVQGYFTLTLTYRLRYDYRVQLHVRPNCTLYNFYGTHILRQFCLYAIQRYTLVVHLSQNKSSRTRQEPQSYAMSPKMKICLFSIPKNLFSRIYLENRRLHVYPLASTSIPHT